MGVTLERVQFKFASIIGELCNEPKILSQFAVWLDMRLAEFKLRGSISLDCSGEPVPPGWIEGLEEVMAKKVINSHRKISRISEEYIDIAEDEDGNGTEQSSRTSLFPVSLDSSTGTIPVRHLLSENAERISRKRTHSETSQYFHSPQKNSKLSTPARRTCDISDSTHTQSLASIISGSDIEDSATSSSIPTAVYANDRMNHQIEHNDSAINASDFLRGDNSSSIVYVEENSAPLSSTRDDSAQLDEIPGSNFNTSYNSMLYTGAVTPQRRERTCWSAEEKNAIIENLLPIVQRTRKPPMKADVYSLMEKEPALQHRHWEKVKFQAWSMYQQMVKKQKNSSQSSQDSTTHNHQNMLN